MAFKLQLTDEMIRFFRTPQISDADAGCLIRLLIDAAEEQPLPAAVPQPLTFTLPIFLGQIEAFRENYKRKVEGSAERMRRHRQKESEDDDMLRVTSVATRNKRNMRNNAQQALQRATGATGATERNAHGYAFSYQTRPDQNKPEQTESSSRPFGRFQEGADGRPVGIESYDQIFDGRNDPVEMALELCQESRPRMAAAGYVKQLHRIGEDAFRTVLAAFWGEIEAGEEPRNRGAAFNARLKEQRDFDPEDAEAARVAVAALKTKPGEDNP